MQALINSVWPGGPSARTGQTIGLGSVAWGKESMDIDFGEQVKSLDRTTLLPIVRRALDDKAAEILAWTALPLKGLSAVGHIFRLTGTARSHADVVVWSLILKIVPSPANKQVKFNFLSDEPSHFGYWKREMLLYQSGLCDELPDGLTAPDCYQASADRDSYWLWLEDITDTTQWSIASYGLAARRFGHLNGLYAVQRPIPSWSWLVRDEGLPRWIIDQQLVTGESWRQISDLGKQHPFIRHAWPDDVIEGMQLLWGEREEFFSLLRKLPKTLIHGDAARKNLFARARKQGDEEFVAIDWGLAGLAPLGQEISGLTIHTVFGRFLPPGELAELDTCIFNEYLQGLHDVGWKGDPRIVRLGYTARTALHFSLGLTVLRREMIFLDAAAGRKHEVDTGQSMDEHLHILATLCRFILALAEEARALKSALNF